MAKTAAVFCALGMGDGLIYSVVSHNLQRNGYDVVTYSTPLLQLQPWIATHRILPFPEATRWLDECHKYDLVVIQNDFPAMELNPQKEELRKLKHVHLIYNYTLDSKKSLVENLFSDVCPHRLGLVDVVRSNGLVPPAPLQSRRYPKRIAIHCACAEEQRAWPLKRYLKVARRLQKEGYEPVFIVSPSERKQWAAPLIQAGFPPPHFPTLIDLASFIYESGYVIGNDSGVGHLGSCLKVPTVTVFRRASRSYFWQPGWAPGMRVTALPLVPSRYLRLLLWKKLLVTPQVIYNFHQLAKKIEA